MKQQVYQKNERIRKVRTLIISVAVIFTHRLRDGVEGKNVVFSVFSW